MKYVLDSSVAFKRLIPESDSAQALRTLDGYRDGTHELIAPDILPIEVGHALTRAERTGRVTTAAGYALWLALMADCPRLAPSLSLMPRAYLLSSQMRVGIYDCLYVALAEQEPCALLTADARLMSVVSGIVSTVALDAM